MKMPADVFLSRNGIRYDEFGGFHGTPAEIVANLKGLNATRQLDGEGRLEDLVHYSAGFQPVPTNPSTFEPAMVKKERLAMQAYWAALETGDLDKTHAAADAINAVRSVKSGGIFLPAPDFYILAHGKNTLGETARFIVSERASIEETGFPTMAGSPLPWYDTAAAFHQLNAL